MAGGVAAYVHREQIYNSLSHLSMPTRESIAGIKYKENISQGLTYVSRDAIGEGFTWMASHLKFVGALMKTGQLTSRLERLQELEGVGLANLYTSLGENGVWNGGYFVPKRTFCAVPTGDGKEKEAMWREVPNPKAENEIYAHCSMFRKEKNAGYDFMLEEAKQLVCAWVSNNTQEVKDDYKPSREVLHRSMSEHKAWDDDGKVLESVPAKEVKSTENEEAIVDESEKEETEDEKQLQAILKCADMPLPEEGDKAEFVEALDVPLPVDEDVDASTRVLGLSEIGQEATEIPLPNDLGSADGHSRQEEEEKKPTSTRWFNNTLSGLYVIKKQERKAESQEQEESKGEKPQAGGWFKNPVPILYGKAKETQELKNTEELNKTENINGSATEATQDEEQQPAGEHTSDKPEEDPKTDTVDDTTPENKSEEKSQSSGWFKNPIPSLYSAKKEDPK